MTVKIVQSPIEQIGSHEQRFVAVESVTNYIYGFIDAWTPLVVEVGLYRWFSRRQIFIFWLFL